MTMASMAYGKSQLETVEALTGLARSSSGKSFAALTLGISKTLGTSFSSLEALKFQLAGYVFL